MRYKSILLFGAPGSGKGTQGKILGAIPGFYHSACGDVFRSLDLQSEMGRVFWEYAGKGKLVPDEFTVKLWKQYIHGMEMVNQFFPETQILVLDGIPRNVEQAKLLEDTLEVSFLMIGPDGAVESVEKDVPQRRGDSVVDLGHGRRPQRRRAFRSCTARRSSARGRCSTISSSPASSQVP